MSKRSEPVEGAGFARFFSAGSRSLKWAPPLDRLIVGNNNIPKGWIYTKTPADLTDSWIHFDGDPNATRIGHDDLEATLGLWKPEARLFIPAESAQLREAIDIAKTRTTIPIA